MTPMASQSGAMAPMPHPSDVDSATCVGLLRAHGPAQDFKRGIEASHATRSGRRFAHHLQVSSNAGMPGSLDAHRGNPQNGFGTDQFRRDVYDTVAAMRVALRQRGPNFDARVHRESSDAGSMLAAHIGDVGAPARGLEVACEASPPEDCCRERDAGFDDGDGLAFVNGEHGLQDPHAIALRSGEPRQRSDRQELAENLVNQYLRRWAHHDTPSGGDAHDGNTER